MTDKEYFKEWKINDIVRLKSNFIDSRLKGDTNNYKQKFKITYLGKHKTFLSNGIRSFQSKKSYTNTCDLIGLEDNFKLKSIGVSYLKAAEILEKE